MCEEEGNYDCGTGALHGGFPLIERFSREAMPSQASLVREEFDLPKRFPWLNILMRNVSVYPTISLRGLTGSLYLN